MRHTGGVEEDWVDLDGFAALLGHADQRTLSSWRARGAPAGHPVPEPDDVVVERGHARPRWRRSTVEAWIAARPGRGRRVSV